VIINEEVFGHLNLLINLGINGENPNVVTQTDRGSLRLKSLLRYRLGQLLLEVCPSIQSSGSFHTFSVAGVLVTQDTQNYVYEFITFSSGLFVVSAKESPSVSHQGSRFVLL
tara:strand:+ start:726 stop:1061 length:336 start_codon:yes stop_codon:yes gene_type:complete